MSMYLLLSAIPLLILADDGSSSQEYTAIGRSYGLGGSADGLIYSMFGKGPNGELADTWSYDLATADWKEIFDNTTSTILGDSSPMARSRSCWADDVHSFWVYGGQTLDGCANDLWELDKTTHQWTLVMENGRYSLEHDTFGARCGHSCAVLNGYLYIYGGWQNAETQERYYNSPIMYNHVDLYTVDELGSEGPSARQGQAATITTDGLSMLLHGGIDAEGTVLNDAYKLTPIWNISTAAVWTDLGQAVGSPNVAYHSIVPDPGSDANYFIFGGQMASGGYSGVNYLFTETGASAEIPLVLNVSDPSYVLLGRCAHQAALGSDNNMYIWGGDTQETVFVQDMWMFDTDARVWYRIEGAYSPTEYIFPTDFWWWLWLFTVPALGLMFYYGLQRSKETDGYQDIDGGLVH